MRRRPRAFERLTRCYEIERELRALRHADSPAWQRRVTSKRLRLEQQFLVHYGSSVTVPPWRVRLRALDPDRPPPDFAVVAPIKSGSSDIASRLMLHPCVLAPLAKEITEGPARWGPYFPSRRQRDAVVARREKAVTGYFGPFLDDPALADQLVQANANLRLVILLRDPVARAYSHWKWEAWLGGRGIAALPEYIDFDRFVDLALAAYPQIPLETSSGYPVLDSGMYTTRVSAWLARMGERPTLVLDADEYFAAPATTLDRVQEFLGLPHVRIGDFEARTNENPLSRAPMSPRAAGRLTEFYAADQAALRARLGR